MNEKVIAGLNNSSKVSDIYAYLVDEKGTQTYVFLYNPESKEFSRESKYDEGVPALGSISSQHYRNTTGLTLNLPNLLLETYNQGKSCKLLLQRLQSLMVADPKNGKYAPTPVYFKWGTDSFGPAVITGLSWVETSWLNGEVASARVNLSLLEIPQDPTKQLGSSTQKRLQAALNKKKILTARQQEDASRKSKEWLKINIKKLPENIASLVRVNRYKLSTSSTGTVTLYDPKNRELGTVGTLVGNKFNTSNNTLIKK